MANYSLEDFVKSGLAQYICLTCIYDSIKPSWVTSGVYLERIQALFRNTHSQAYLKLPESFNSVVYIWKELVRNEEKFLQTNLGITFEKIMSIEKLVNVNKSSSRTQHFVNFNNHCCHFKLLGLLPFVQAGIWFNYYYLKVNSLPIIQIGFEWQLKIFFNWL